MNRCLRGGGFSLLGISEGCKKTAPFTMEQRGFCQVTHGSSAELNAGRKLQLRYAVPDPERGTGLTLLARKVLAGHRYREVIESLSKSKFATFLPGL
ncbi:hypothetical protein GF108_15585 [Phyllobacterium sp. SYP-B3895]|uniref:hypothetical protein n=1 Tax=Phyllobacterium sp. SYP-B3895 TaxID=2663240 RepID=UPI001299B632|nr:hypothetical protein [Phyllobacterium sp. SYP-B3895]MRG56998.1 hypothetical protein [Phyllobacterium sp. SYP-B3895]